MTDLQSTLDAIDAVTADACAWCQTTLTDASHSRDFCSQDHQARWQAAQLDVEPDPELLNHPLTAVRSQIAGALAQRVPAARVFVNGHELPAHNVRLVYQADLVFVDELPAFLLPRLRHAMASVGAAFEALFEHIRPAMEQLQQLAPQLAPPKPPSDPRARALWLRQNRNTGPAPKQQRAPRVLDTARRRTR